MVFQNRWKKVVVCILCIGVYVTSYHLNVTPGGSYIVAANAKQNADGSFDPNVAWIGPDYRFGGTLAHGLFMPANEIDRYFRPDIWGRYSP